MIKYCMLNPITQCSAGLTLGIIFSVNMGVRLVAAPGVSVHSRPGSRDSRGSATSMRVLGQGDVVYEARPGTGVLFLSELWHRTETATPGTMKVTLFFGVWC